MTAEINPGKKFDEAERRFWNEKGPLVKACLLVIPAMAILCGSIGSAYQEGIPSTIFGIGIGLVLWGAIASYVG